MIFRLDISGFSETQFVNGFSELEKIPSRLGLAVRFRWDSERERIVAEGESIQPLDSLGAKIADEVADALNIRPIDRSTDYSWNQRNKWWDCPNLSLDTLSLPVAIECDPGTAPCEAGVNTYLLLQSDLKTACESWLRFAAEELVDVYNNSWREGPDEITTEDLASKLVPESISIYDKGDYSVYCFANSLFGFHSVVIEVNASNMPTGIRLG